MRKPCEAIGEPLNTMRAPCENYENRAKTVLKSHWKAGRQPGRWQACCSPALAGQPALWQPRGSQSLLGIQPRGSSVAEKRVRGETAHSGVFVWVAFNSVLMFCSICVYLLYLCIFVVFCQKEHVLLLLPMFSCPLTRMLHGEHSSYAIRIFFRHTHFFAGSGITQ